MELFYIFDYYFMQKVLLVIRDGWGYRESSVDNAIAQADTPFTDSLMENYPNVLLDASGAAVGLPDGYMWNSEVWHMTIWSGRIIDQSLTRINKSIADWSFFRNQVLLDMIKYCKKNNSHLHLMWLLQGEWVHAHIDHVFALLDFCKRQEFENVLIHIFTDGRDAPVTYSEKYIKLLEDKLQELWFGKIVSITWRYFAMDRDNRWERTQKTYNVIIDWKTDRDDFMFDSPFETIKKLHEEWETDEFIKPIKSSDYKWIQDTDGIIFRNFRTDRTRQLTKIIMDNTTVKFVAMTQYYDDMVADVVFPQIELKNILWELVSNAGYRQLRISETEKYAHVTFFMNGQIDKAFLNEDRVLIDSPSVDTYDKTPEMSIVKLTDRLCLELEKEKYQLVITNFVNWDMIWHTGAAAAIIKWIEAIDQALEKTVKAALAHDYVIIVTADHGNAEDQTEKWRTSHTLNSVPCILVWKDFKKSAKNTISLKQGRGLQDIAPTILYLLGILKPNDMTWTNLIN